MKRLFVILLALGSVLRAAEPVQDGVVDLEAQVQGQQDEGWAALESELKGDKAQQALDAWLKKHPKGRSAARAHLERARRQDDLALAAEAYKLAVAEDKDGPWGQLALLEWGKQEYVLGRQESALMLLSQASEEALQGEAKNQLLFWRGQSRLVLKGVERAQDDFENFIRLAPDHALADSARLAVADCDALQGHYEAAFAGYARLYQAPPSSVAPQALLQAGILQLKLGKKAEARELLLKIGGTYPEASELSRARELLKDLPATVAVTPVPTPAKVLPPSFTIQVGAYSRHAIADVMVKKLKQRGYPVRVDKRVLDDNVFHIVQVGRYPSKADAQKVADKLTKREKLNYRIVESTPAP